MMDEDGNGMKVTGESEHRMRQELNQLANEHSIYIPGILWIL